MLQISRIAVGCRSLTVACVQGFWLMARSA
jgi:hypothetical protein